MEPQAISSDLIRGHIDTIILSTLIDQDKYAQQISDAVQEKSNGDYKMNQATLYSSLKRLETLKYVNSYWNDASDGRRKYFRLTIEGKKAVDENLSNWSYSRSIIDKLIDFKSEQEKTIVKTEYVEKIVEKIVEVPVYKTIVEPSPINTTPSHNVQVQAPILDTKDNKEIEQTAEKELNFRHILGGLIQVSNIVENTTIQDIEPLNKEKSLEVEKTEEKLSFNDTISSTDYNSHKSNNGKIDFGDLLIKASKEGFKIKISSKEPIKKDGTLLINKLKMFSAITIFVIALTEYLILNNVYGAIFNISSQLSVIIPLIMAIFPIYALFKHFTNTKYCTAKNIHVDSILTAFIVCFNLILITLAGNLLLNPSFIQFDSMLKYFIIPSVLFFDIILYYVIRYAFSKSETFRLNPKK